MYTSKIFVRFCSKTCTQHCSIFWHIIPRKNLYLMIPIFLASLDQIVAMQAGRSELWTAGPQYKLWNTNLNFSHNTEISVLQEAWRYVKWPQLSRFLSINAHVYSEFCHEKVQYVFILSKSTFGEQALWSSALTTKFWYSLVLA